MNLDSNILNELLVSMDDINIQIIDKGSFSMKYYVKTSNSCYISWYGNFDSNGFMITSIELNNIISANRLQLSENKRWSAIAMTVDSDGRMDTYFDYTNVIEDQIEYEQNWEKKHLI